MTPQRRLEIECAANLYGSANCWTGTSGGLAAMIRELLAEIDRLEAIECKYITLTNETNDDNWQQDNWTLH